ncbi:MAG: hypothetical protein E6805_19170 [Citrobacter freundii]|uniref:hypothetical protein n=1 Tax=Citrobacter freundii TaxID=546 RepID=UPI001BA6EF41|nr:hypothetical protein [Citrobacter freundii]MDU7723250.1 hypothetical protein [Citrobacter sp.]MBQ5150369.1 hypothetical protein [Citrobacter freundii]MDU1356032.1 hypothetical protein [Citrobacter freundii]MDU1699689.1 hypothetical protein [Citrobacter freundii]MDU1733882.1 hypothetical protein [Citrobacter freundii]
MKIRCLIGLHKWVLFKKELHPYQSLTGLQPTIIFHYGCNGCGKKKEEIRQEGYWHTFRHEDLNHEIK